MKNEDMEKITNQIREKIGEDYSAMISDDLVSIISDNQQRNRELENRDTEIQALKKSKNEILELNGKLFQQVTMAEEPPKNQQGSKDEEQKKFSFKSVFDEKGNFIN